MAPARARLPGRVRGAQGLLLPRLHERLRQVLLKRAGCAAPLGDPVAAQAPIFFSQNAANILATFWINICQLLAVFSYVIVTFFRTLNKSIVAKFSIAPSLPPLVARRARPSTALGPRGDTRYPLTCPSLCDLFDKEWTAKMSFTSFSSTKNNFCQTFEETFR